MFSRMGELKPREGQGQSVSQDLSQEPSLTHCAVLPLRKRVQTGGRGALGGSSPLGGGGESKDRLARRWVGGQPG